MGAAAGRVSSVAAGRRGLLCCSCITRQRRAAPPADRLPRGGGSGQASLASARRDQPSHVWYLRAELEQGRELIQATVTSLRFAVIGAGRLGASFALAMRDQGAQLVAYTADTAAGRSRAETWLGGAATVSLDDIAVALPDLYLVAVPDQALPGVAADLAAALGRLTRSGSGAQPHGEPPVVAHTSGATSVHLLCDCEQAGAAALAFHPLQTFSDPATGRARFAGAAVALTTTDGRLDTRAGVMGLRIAQALGARPFLLADSKRRLYHAAASVACNYLVTLEHHARRLFVEAGLPEDEALSLFLPLVNATLDNVARQGPVKALTGPLSRGDLDTIEGHLAALGDDSPDLLALYRVLGLATLDLVRARGEVSETVVAELADLLTHPQPGCPGA